MAIIGGISADTTNAIVEDAHVTNNNVHVMDAFSPSSYLGAVNATTNSTAQAILLVAGVKLGAGRVRCACGTTGERLLVAFGGSSQDAADNAADGTPFFYGVPDLLKVPDSATHLGYQGATGATTGHITQGV